MSEYFEKKQTRDEELARNERIRRIKKVLKWFGIAGVVGIAGYWIFTTFNTPSGPLPGQYFQAQSQDHIAVGTPHDEYNSNPPTGGPHYAAPAQSGIYDQEFPDEQLVHNLEHGHIWIAYRNDLPKEQIEILADIAKSYSSKVIMTLRPKNPTPVSVVAWEYLLNLETFDEQKIKDFMRAHRGKGPETIPDFGFKDFRGQATSTPIPQTSN